MAELARLIGQSDPYEDSAGRYDSEQSDGRTAATGLDWAADDSYAEQHDLAEDRHVSPPPQADSYSYPPQDREYDNPARRSGRFFSGPAAKFQGLSEDADAAADDARYDEQALNSSYGSPAFVSGSPDDHSEADEDQNRGDADYPADAYDEGASNPRRRSGLVVVAAVLGLAVFGSAGAFGYRTMFGRSVLSALPPIIKPTAGPNKIMPNYGESQAGNSTLAGAMAKGAPEKLVSHEEQPVDVQATPQGVVPPVAPHVVSTIPIIGPSSAPPFAATPAAPAPAASAATTPAPVVASADAFAATPALAPATAPPQIAASPPPAQMAAPLPPSAPAAAAALSEPKKIHTVTIRADQANDAKTAANMPAPTASNTAHHTARVPKPRKSATKRAAGPNAPLSLVPTAQDDAYAAPPPRAAVPRTTVASAAPLAITGTATARSAGGYAVQVTSRRSEAEAHSAYRALQAKFPNQLGGREPIIRRADLGAKGTYYRALVGPFASMEEAARICSSLKAAGGNCLVQKD